MEDYKTIAAESAAIYEILHRREQQISPDIFERSRRDRPKTKRIGIFLLLVALFTAIFLVTFVAWFFDRSDHLKLALLVMLLVGYVCVIIAVPPTSPRVE